MKEYNKVDVINRIEQQAYKLRHRRHEGFSDETLESDCIVHEIKYLFRMLDSESQKQILDQPWLDG